MFFNFGGKIKILEAIARLGTELNMLTCELSSLKTALNTSRRQQSSLPIKDSTNKKISHSYPVLRGPRVGNDEEKILAYINRQGGAVARDKLTRSNLLPGRGSYDHVLRELINSGKLVEFRPKDTRLPNTVYYSRDRAPSCVQHDSLCGPESYDHSMLGV